MVASETLPRQSSDKGPGRCPAVSEFWETLVREWLPVSHRGWHTPNPLACLPSSLTLGNPMQVSSGDKAMLFRGEREGLEDLPRVAVMLFGGVVFASIIVNTLDTIIPIVIAYGFFSLGSLPISRTIP